MGYRYKRDTSEHIVKRKARFATRGDTMLLPVHYNPDRTTTYIDDKSSAFILLAMAASHNLNMEQIDIKVTYLHDNVDHSGQNPFM